MQIDIPHEVYLRLQQRSDDPVQAIREALDSSLVSVIQELVNIGRWNMELGGVPLDINEQSRKLKKSMTRGGAAR